MPFSVIVGGALVAVAFAIDQAAGVPRSVHVVTPGRRARPNQARYVHGHD